MIIVQFLLIERIGIRLFVNQMAFQKIQSVNQTLSIFKFFLSVEHKNV